MGRTPDTSSTTEPVRIMELLICGSRSQDPNETNTVMLLIVTLSEDKQNERSAEIGLTFVSQLSISPLKRQIRCPQSPKNPALFCGFHFNSVISVRLIRAPSQWGDGLLPPNVHFKKKKNLCKKIVINCWRLVTWLLLILWHSEGKSDFRRVY